VVASTWKHYQAATDTTGKSTADVVSEGFWVILCFHIDHFSVVQYIFPYIATCIFNNYQFSSSADWSIYWFCSSVHLHIDHFSYALFTAGVYLYLIISVEKI